MSRGVLLKAGVLLALVVAAVVLQLSVGLPSQAELRSTLDGLGGWGVPAFVAAYAAISLLPAGPTAVMTVLGGLLLGFGTGLVAVLGAAVVGAVSAFLLSRVLGRDAVRSLTGVRFASLDERVRAHGFATVLLARLIPLVPFSTANYAFGLTSVSTARTPPPRCWASCPARPSTWPSAPSAPTPARRRSCWRSPRWCCSPCWGCGASGGRAVLHPPTPTP